MGPGTICSVVIRWLQIIFASLSLYFLLPNSTTMSIYTAYRVLFAALIINMSWCVSLWFFDIYALVYPDVLHNRRRVLLTVFTVGDMLVAYLTLGGASASAAVSLYFLRDSPQCTYIPRLCRQTATSIALAFIAWFFTQISGMVMFRLRSKCAS